MSRRVASLTAAFIAFIAVGCGGPASVNGKVTFNNLAVKTGSVTFRNADGGVFSSQINDGAYTVELPSGTYQIAIASPDPKSTPAADQPGGGRSLTPAPKTAPKKSEGWFPLPPKFADPTASGQSTTLKPGPNQFDITLTDK